MQFKLLSVAAVLGILCTGCLGISYASRDQASMLSGLQPASGEEGGPLHGFAGGFLASHFAQSQYDWGTAKRHLSNVLEKDPENTELLRRAMILSAGSGDMKTAVKYAAALFEKGEGENLSRMILAVDSLVNNDFELANTYLSKMPGGDVTEFLKPVLLSWSKAGQGQEDTEGLGDNPVHLYHGALVMFYLGNKEASRKYANKLMQSEGISAYEGERAADLLALLGEEEAALGFYKGLQLQGGSNKVLERKIKALQEDPPKIESLLSHVKAESPAVGAALAIEDLARILFQENSDSSAQLFANLVITLHPELMDAHILLADILTRNDRYDEAIAHLLEIPEDYYAYLETRYKIADLMAQADRTEEARILLEDLFKSYGDIETIIKIGDLYRVDEDYKNSLKAYNKAAQNISKDKEKDYWYLFYARGMSYEREGKWQKAESDLQKALSYQPNHPYLLNYLGYSWADQGINLDESLELIKKAVSLRPSDGYIVDSLGWVYFMLGRYEEALPYLERAAELLSYDPVINDHLGDAYWQTGRHMEARFQWERARNYAEDIDIIEKMEAKLKNGLVLDTVVREAQSRPSVDLKDNP